MLVRTYLVDQGSGKETLHWEGQLAECFPDDPDELAAVRNRLVATRQALVGGGAMPLVMIRHVNDTEQPSYEQIQARALICALADACWYLNEDRAKHLFVHGEWSLDVCTLQVALEHGGENFDTG